MNQTIWVNAMETSIKLHVLRFQWPGDHWTGWRWSVYFHHSGLMNTQLLFESPGVCGTSSWVLAPERWGEIQISSLCWTRKNLTIPFPPTLEILQWFLYLPVSTIIQKKSNFTKLAVKKKKSTEQYCLNIPFYLILLTMGDLSLIFYSYKIYKLWQPKPGKFFCISILQALLYNI